MSDDQHEQMHEQPQGEAREWRVPVLTEVGEQTRFIVITVKDGREVWSTPKYPFVFPRGSKALLLAAVVEADGLLYGDPS